MNWSKQMALEQFNGPIIKVGASSFSTPASIPTNFETIYDEDETKMWSFQELYDSTNEVLLACILTYAENIRFQEMVIDKKWQTTINEETKWIDRNNTCELVELLKEN